MDITTLQNILDRVRTGDNLEFSRSNSEGLSSTIKGKALVRGNSVSIDTFDGEPHQIRSVKRTINGKPDTLWVYEDSSEGTSLMSWYSDEQEGGDDADEFMTYSELIQRVKDLETFVYTQTAVGTSS